MKILQLCPRVPFPPVDGGAIAMVSMREGLEENGCTVKVFCFNTTKHPVRIDGLDQSLVRRLGLESVDVDNRVRPINAFLNLVRNKSYHLSRFSSKAFEGKLEEILKRERFDAVILESIFMQEAIPVIRKMSSAPVILRAHNVEHAIWQGLAATVKNPWKRWYLKRLAGQLEREEKRILSEVDGIIAITEDDARTIESLISKVPVFVSPTGIHVENYKWNPDPNPLIVAHIGAMDWQPNVEGIRWFLNEIWPKVFAVIPEARLKLAGKNMPDSLMQYGKAEVSVQGFVSDAHEFLFEAGVVVIPLLNGSGMRIKLLESMALGKAIVSTGIGCEGVPVRNGNEIRIADTSQDFADALIDLLRNHDLQSQMRVKARELVAERFDNRSIGSGTVRFIGRLSKLN